MFGIRESYSTNKYCYAATNVAVVGIKNVICPECGRLVPEKIIYQGENALIIEGGEIYPDFMFYGSAGLTFIVSERVLEALQQNGITGYDKSEKVPIYRSKERRMIEQDVAYYMLNITGEIDFDLKAMALRKKHLCPLCGEFEWSRQRLGTIDSVFDMSTWNGSDLCRIKSFPGYIVVSEKFKCIVEQNKFIGIIFNQENSIFK